MMGLSGKIGVGVSDSLAVFAVSVDEKSVSANEDCENHRHQQRYFPYCPSHKEMRYEMRLQNYKRIPSRPNPPGKRAGQSSRSGLNHESGGLQEGTVPDVMAPCQNELSDTASLCYWLTVNDQRESARRDCQLIHQALQAPMKNDTAPNRMNTTSPGMRSHPMRLMVSPVTYSMERACQ